MEENIKIQPSWRYWLANNVIMIIPIGLMFYFSQEIMQIELLKLGVVAIILLLILIMTYKYFLITIFTEFTITPTQIKIAKGIFFRNISYIELYRVCDYEEKENIFYMVLGVKNIYIHSTDKSTPILLIPGVNTKNKIIDVIRERVELERQKKKIFEISNR